MRFTKNLKRKWYKDKINSNISTTNPQKNKLQTFKNSNSPYSSIIKLSNFRTNFEQKLFSNNEKKDVAKGCLNSSRDHPVRNPDSSAETSGRGWAEPP